MRIPRLSHAQIIRLGRILDMLYKPSELAEEIDVNVDTIYRSYLPAGLPHICRNNTFWIHGPAFVEWAKQTIAARHANHVVLPDGHGWCVKCSGIVAMDNPQIKYTNPYIHILQAPCPDCKRPVNRAVKNQARAS